MVALGTLLRRSRAAGHVTLMGVLNATPDSFSDGGAYAAPDAARARVDALLEAGADIVDVGGESTRPGAPAVSASEQMARVEPALRHACARGARVSIDTTDPEVAEWALERGASIVNDTSCVANVELARVAARAGASLVVMHSRGAMAAMPGFSTLDDGAYADVAREVVSELRAAVERARAAGVSADAIAVDPGLGFWKNARQSIELLGQLDALAELDLPVLVGASRKSFLAQARPAAVGDRLGGTVAACLAAVDRGAAALRVHDVAPVRQALELWHALGSR